jgi:hypothetical protein
VAIFLTDKYSAVIGLNISAPVIAKRSTLCHLKILPGVVTNVEHEFTERFT